jgi:hypothetical protein
MDLPFRRPSKAKPRQALDKIKEAIKAAGGEMKAFYLTMG